MKMPVTQVLALAVLMAGATCIMESCTINYAPISTAGPAVAGPASPRREMVPAPVALRRQPRWWRRVPSSCNFAGVQYPRIEADGRVTFRFNAPDAQKVQVSIVSVSRSTWSKATTACGPTPANRRPPGITTTG